MRILSEYGYGFGLTRELSTMVGAGLSAVPIFPNLVEEGRVGGGYDVNLAGPGFPLFLQFKLSQEVERRPTWLGMSRTSLNMPHYRFQIRARKKSRQHDLLLELDNGKNHVFYVAPRFDTDEEFSEAYLKSKLLDDSIFVRPRDIVIIDDDAHRVHFDGKKAVISHGPREIFFTDGAAMRNSLLSALISDGNRLDDGRLDQIYRQLVNALGKFKIPFDQAEDESKINAMAPEARALRRIRQLADTGLEYLGAQFVLVQAGG